MPPRACSFAGLILAAGASSRMGADKALLSYNGSTFLESAIALLKPVTDLVIVVAGANAAALDPLIHQQSAFLIRNPKPEQGQFSSLRIGLNEVLNRGRDAVILTLVDRPAASIDTLVQLKCEFVSLDPRDAWAVVPEFGGKHGHPILFGRELIEAFLRAPADSTARDVEHAHQEKVRYIPVADPNVALNINTPEDYQQLTIS